MSRHTARHARGKKGHGAIGFLVTLVLILLVLALVFLFTSDSAFKGVKSKVYSAFYPQKYSEQVQKYSKEFGVEEALVYAVIRTESGFRSDAESSAGAVGLMQLMPSTFDWLQENLYGEVVYTADALRDPDVNIRFGTYLLSILLKEYNENMKTAVAAYNAGNSTVNGWLEDPQYSPDGSSLTNIPYEETANYVKRVSNAYDMYKELYGGT